VELYIVRHGPAAERNPQRWADDDRRPLTPEGVRETRKAVRGFARLVGKVDRLFSSPAVRAHRTAELLLEELKDAPELELMDLLAPGSPAVGILGEMHQIARPRSRVVLVGHEPTLGELIGLAVTGEAVSIARLAKAGAAALEFPRAVLPSAARLTWLMSRKQLGRAAD
jgi:phosphohistidine phosphatase